MQEKTEQVWIAIGTFLGVCVSRVLGPLVKNRAQESSQMRSDLRGELASLKKELRTLTRMLDIWKTKYYELVADNLQCKSLNERFRVELDQIKEELLKRP